MVVNHLWLEECFQTWSDLPPSDDRYVHFPGAEILSEIVGQTRLEKENVDMWRHDAEKLPDVVPLNPQSSRGIVSFSDFDRGSVRPAPAAPNQALKSPSDKGVQVHRPRQAAVEASQNLQDVFVPDMNAYQKEKSKAPARRSRELSMEPKGKRKRSVSPENLGDVEMKEATKPVQKRSREGSAKESSPAKEPSEGLLDKDVEEASKPEEQSKGEDHEEAKSTITHPKIATTGIELKGDEKSVSIVPPISGPYLYTMLGDSPARWSDHQQHHGGRFPYCRRSRIAHHQIFVCSESGYPYFDCPVVASLTGKA